METILATAKTPDEAVEKFISADIGVPKRTRKKRVKRSKMAESQRKSVKVPKKTRKKGNTGKRYTDAQRKEILDFIESSGRGGTIKAMRKWGVSYLAIRSWLRKKGVKVGKRGKGKRGRPVGSGRRRGRSPALKSPPVFSKRAHRKIQKALDRMGHGIRLLAEGFSHLA